MSTNVCGNVAFPKLCCQTTSLLISAHCTDSWKYSSPITTGYVGGSITGQHVSAGTKECFACILIDHLFTASLVSLHHVVWLNSLMILCDLSLMCSLVSAISV